MNQIPQVTAPLGGSSNKRDDVQNLPAGARIGRIYGMVHIGEQYSQRFNDTSHKIVMLVEFGELRQLIYDDDTEPRPKVISQEFTLSMGSKANLRKFVEAISNRKLTDDEAKNFNPYSLIDKYFVFQIMHTTSKSNGNTYENITTAMPYSDQFKIQGADYTPYNEVMMFHIPTHGFQSQEYQKVYNYLRNKIKESEEGKKWLQQGGTFNDPQQNDGDGNTSGGVNNGPQPLAQGMVAPPNNGQPQQQPAQQFTQPQTQAFNQNASAPGSGNGPQAPQQQVPQQQAKPQLQMLVNDYTYEQYKSSKWTDEMLVQNGKAKWVTPQQTSQSAPQGPGPNAQPNFSAPPAQQMGGIQGDGGNDDLPF